MAKSPHTELRKLLLSLFTKTDAQRFILDEFGEEVANAVNWDQSWTNAAGQLVEELGRRGLMRERLFEGLVGVRPEREDDIKMMMAIPALQDIEARPPIAVEASENVSTKVVGGEQLSVMDALAPKRRVNVRLLWGCLSISLVLTTILGLTAWTLAPQEVPIALEHFPIWNIHPNTRRCSELRPWNGRVYGWGLPARQTAYCQTKSVRIGHYLHISSSRNEHTALLEVQNAKDHIERVYGHDALCTTAELLVFVSHDLANVSTGLFYERKPSWWNAVVAQEHSWLLLDSNRDAVKGPICAFPAPERSIPNW